MVTKISNNDLSQAKAQGVAVVALQKNKKQIENRTEK